MRWPVLLVLMGCHAGGGPILAYSTRGGVRLGAEVTGGFAFARGSVGTSFAPSGGGPSRTYLVFDPAIAFPVDESTEGDFSERLAGGVGAMIGVSTTDAGSIGLAAGGYGLVSTFVGNSEFSIFGSCPQASSYISVSIGGRWLSGVAEWFIAPKVGYFRVCG